MRLVPLITQAFSNLTASRMRSFLAVLGILVGTASVVAMVSSGKMATEAALAQFKNLGTDLLAVSIQQGSASEGSSGSKGFDLEDALNLPQVSPLIRAVAPYTTIYVPIASEGVEIQGSIIGVTAQLQSMIRIQMSTGRFISFLDRHAYYGVIGHKLAEQLKAAGIWNPIGKQIQLGSTMFTIVGVAAPWPENSFFYEDINSAVIIPIRASNLITKNAKISNVVLLLQPGLTIADITQVQNKITRYVEIEVPGAKLFFRSAKELIHNMEAQSQILTLLLGAIAGISLLVGGIGVMNIMLVSVIERRREIGIRLAVGARRRDIQRLFLAEAVILSLFGGVLGVIVGAVASYVIAILGNWPYIFFAWPPGLGCAVSIVTGVFFGFYPAYKASQLDPIQALRSD